MELHLDHVPEFLATFAAHIALRNGAGVQRRRGNFGVRFGGRGFFSLEVFYRLVCVLLEVVYGTVDCIKRARQLESVDRVDA
jgi:hypothetical protein